MYIINYLIIIFYLTTFFKIIYVKLILSKYKKKNDKIDFIPKNPLWNKIYNLKLFMYWEMFDEVSPSKNQIKIIVETKNGEIDIYYFIDENLKKIIPELNIKTSCYAPLIHKYPKYNFLTQFIIEKIKEKYKDNLLYISFYKLIYLKNDEDDKMKIHNYEEYYSLML